MILCSLKMSSLFQRKEALLRLSHGHGSSNYYLEECEHFTTGLTNSSVQHDLLHLHKSLRHCETPVFYIRQFSGQPFITWERVGLNNFIKFSGRKTIVICNFLEEGGLKLVLCSYVLCESKPLFCLT